MKALLKKINLLGYPNKSNAEYISQGSTIMKPVLSFRLNTHGYYMRFLIPLLLLFTFATGFGQDLAELEKRNGFKDIKLGMVVDSLKGYKLKKQFLENKEFPAKLYSVEHADYDKIGEVKVRSVEVKTYKDLIYEITVITDKDLRMMKALEALYGKSEYDLKKETYFWKSENLALKFRSYNKNRLELEYSSFPVRRKMKEDKNQKVDNISKDF